ncbi:MAG: hypothetical protein CMJ49_06545 [Planctomycetaceae bacterium]|nr:hypothetical protein [Planctomycetaceae bacterium]
MTVWHAKEHAIYHCTCSKMTGKNMSRDNNRKNRVPSRVSAPDEFALTLKARLDPLDVNGTRRLRAALFPDWDETLEYDLIFDAGE